MHIEDLASRLQKYSEIGMKIFLFKLSARNHNETASTTSVNILIASLLSLKTNR